MKQLIRPKALKAGDVVATVSLSWGAAGSPEIRWKYDMGKQRMESLLGVRVKEMPHTLAPEEYVAAHPEARAADLMQAFADPEVKAIICCIGGSDSVKMLPYLDFDVIRKNPKIFTGYSDSTVSNFICMKAGLSAFYGCHVLNDFAENGTMSEYSLESIRRTLFVPEAPGEIKPAEFWCAGDERWTNPEFRDVSREYRPETHGVEVAQGTGTVRGRLIGGCMSVVEALKDTVVFPAAEEFEDTILFFEVVSWAPEHVAKALEDYHEREMLQGVRGILFGKPYDEYKYEEYRDTLVATLKKLGYKDMPLFYNMTFGHNDPKFLIPYGAMAEMDAENGVFRILDPGVE